MAADVDTLSESARPNMGMRSRVAARSIIWAPVIHGEEVSALLSLQSYRADVFGDWHVQLLQDVATHVGLALANAEHFQAAQIERHRLEALHLLEMGVAGAADERQIAEAVVSAVRAFVDAPILMLAYIDAQGRLTGYSSYPDGEIRALAPVHLDSTRKQAVVLSFPRDMWVNIPHQGWGKLTEAYAGGAANEAE